MPIRKDYRHAAAVSGQRTPYTCWNSRFGTDETKGYAHGPGTASGSVFRRPLIVGDGFSLWIEHVVEHTPPRGATLFDGWYWLMWYQSNHPKFGSGVPTIPMSAVFTRDEWGQLLAQLPGLQLP